jgi:hypothetical protein
VRGIIGGLGYRYFTISVPDIHGLMTQLEAKGIKPTLSITEARPGVTIAMVTDPTATRLSFCRTPARNEPARSGCGDKSAVIRRSSQLTASS